MAEAAVDSSNTSVTERFFCHQCTAEIAPVLPDYKCPQCDGGFIEQVSSDSDNVADADRDSDGSSSADGGSGEVTDAALAFTTLFSQILGQAAHESTVPGLPRRPLNLSEVGSNSRSSTSSATESTDGNTSANSATSPSSQSPNLRERVGDLNRLGSRHRHHYRRLPPRPDPAAVDMISLLQQLFQQPTLHATAGGPGAGGGGGMFFPVQMFNLHGNPRDYAWGEGGLDAIITQLLNNVEGQGPPPASKDDLDKLKEVTISNEHTDENLECPVCKEEYANGDVVKAMPCSHLFHPDCIVRWLEMHNTCPVCRKSVDGENTQRDADIGTNLPQDVEDEEEPDNDAPHHYYT